VTFPVWGSGVYSAINVENCEKDGSGCYALGFFANFGKQPTLTPAWMNAWNDNFYIARVYPLTNGETVFTADLMILSGVTPDYVTAFAGFFKQVVDNASTFKPASQ
jgi:Putative bacterial sensory transduction regulator